MKAKAHEIIRAAGSAADMAPEVSSGNVAHTPGPWWVGQQTGHGGISIDAKKRRCVANVYLSIISSRWAWGDETFSQPDNAQSVANAKLIAAAPDLLTAAIEAEAIFTAMSPPTSATDIPEILECLGRLRHAIAKTSVSPTLSAPTAQIPPPSAVAPPRTK